MKDIIDTTYVMFDDLCVGMILIEKSTGKRFVIVEHDECEDSYYSTITIVSESDLIEHNNSEYNIYLEGLDYDILNNGADGIFEEYYVANDTIKLRTIKTIQILIEE